MAFEKGNKLGKGRPTKVDEQKVNNIFLKALGELYNKETEDRLSVWTTLGKDRQYGEYAIHGAVLGKQYGADNFDNLEALKLINNYEWMKNEFDKFYKH